MNTSQIARECPRFDTCSVNNCPLDPHPAYARDNESVCRMEKNVRLRIAARYPGQLSNGGLTPREAAGKRIYEHLPLAVKSQLFETGKRNLRQFNSSKRSKKVC